LGDEVEARRRRAKAQIIRRAEGETKEGDDRSVMNQGRLDRGSLSPWVKSPGASWTCGGGGEGGGGGGGLTLQSAITLGGDGRFGNWDGQA